MATEKILNTRIQLKYDTLANWNASSFKLKAGELAIVTLGENKDGSTAGAVNQHPVLFKVGTGNHTFAELPYASALAADVYAWAKASDVVLTGKTIQFKNGDSVVKSIALNYITENEANTLISNALKSYSTTEQMNTAIKDEADRAKAAEEKIATFGEDGNLTGGALFTEVNSLDGRIDTLEGHVGDSTKGLLKDVADLKSAVGEGGSVDSKIENAIAGLDAEQSQTAGADGLALSITEVDGKITDISGSIAAETYDAYGSAAAAQSAAIAAAKTETETQINTLVTTGAVKTNTDAIAAIKDHATVDSFADVVAELAKKQDTIAENTYDAYGAAEDVKDYADITFATIANLDKYSLAYDSANKEFYLADETGAKQGTSIDAKPFIKDGMLSNVEYNAVNNTLTFTWNTDSGISEDTVVLSDILDPYVAVDTDTIDMTIDGVNISAVVKEGSIAKTHLAKALADELDAKATEADLTLAEGRIKDLEDKATTGSVAKAEVAETANHLAESAKAEVKAVKVDNAAQADAASKVDNALTITTEDGTDVIYDGSAVKSVDLTGLATKAYADQAEADAIATAKAYTDERIQPIGQQVNINKTSIGNHDRQIGLLENFKSQLLDNVNNIFGNADVPVQDGQVLLAIIKDYVDSLADDYATAEQGDKADTAVQTVVGDTGIKATKSGTEVTIGFDPDTVFVFNCGSASTLID